MPLSMDYELYAGGSNSSPELLKRNMTTLSEISSVTKDDLIDSLISNFQSFIKERLKNFEFDKMDKKELLEFEKKYRSDEWNFKF